MLGRAKSPPRSFGNSSLTTNAFKSYAGPGHGFVLPPPKRHRAESPHGASLNVLGQTAVQVATVFGAHQRPEFASGDEAEEGDDEPQSFSERLRAAKDDEDESLEEDEKVKLTEQEGMSFQSVAESSLRVD